MAVHREQRWAVSVSVELSGFQHCPLSTVHWPSVDPSICLSLHLCGQQACPPTSAATNSLKYPTILALHPPSYPTPVAPAARNLLLLPFSVPGSVVRSSKLTCSTLSPTSRPRGTVSRFSAPADARSA